MKMLIAAAVASALALPAAAQEDKKGMHQDHEKKHAEMHEKMKDKMKDKMKGKHEARKGAPSKKDEHKH